MSVRWKTWLSQETNCFRDVLKIEPFLKSVPNLGHALYWLRWVEEYQFQMIWNRLCGSFDCPQVSIELLCITFSCSQGVDRLKCLLKHEADDVEKHNCVLACIPDIRQLPWWGLVFKICESLLRRIGLSKPREAGAIFQWRYSVEKNYLSVWLPWRVEKHVDVLLSKRWLNRGSYVEILTISQSDDQSGEVMSRFRNLSSDV